jgi:ferric-dicitrate binding protein FerR (iron transport regulator)
MMGGGVTLTEYERQALRRIARDLARDDPRLARLLTRPRHTRRRRRRTALALTLAMLAVLALSIALTA